MSVVISSTPRNKSLSATRWDLRYCLKACLLWLGFCAAVGAGVSVRRWVWNSSSDIRFHFDINNGFRWGLSVNQNEQIDFTRPPTWGEFFSSYRDLYAREEQSPSRNPHLDYGPFRLLIMGLWVKSILAVDPRAGGWISRDANSLMWFNTLCALGGALGVYFLLRLWLRRSAANNPLHPPRWIDARAVLAALCLWFNPAILVDAHMWPQWDVWCVPFFIWSVYAGSLGAWFTAGVLIALGAMLKGQLLIASPVLLIWAAFSCGWKGWESVLLIVLGTLTAGVIVGCIWLIPDAHAWRWVGTFILAVIAVGLLMSRTLRRGWVYYVATVLCLGIILGCWIFHGSLDWLYCSFLNSTDNAGGLVASAINFPAILKFRYGWQLDDIVFSLPTHLFGLHDGFSIKWLLRDVYFVLLALCGIAAALQTYRRSPRVLVAFVAAWVLMYAVLPQMRERYLLWGAAFSAIGVGIDLELAILFLFTTAIATMSIYLPISRGGPVADVLNKMVPDLGWVTLLVGLMYFYQAWKRDQIYVRIVSAEHI
jgi:hypothetical protein